MLRGSRVPRHRACWKLKAPISGVRSPDHRRSTMKTLLLSLLVAMLAGVEPGAAQVWPTKPVRIVVPFGPGATPDIVARLLAERLQAKLNQTFVIENKPGASGNLGTEAVVRAEPDGATIGVSIVRPHPWGGGGWSRGAGRRNDRREHRRAARAQYAVVLEALL